MADPMSLSEIGRLAQSPVVIAATPLPADELIKKANEAASPTEEETAFVRLFSQSSMILRGKIEEDEAFAKKILPQLSKLSGEKLAEKIIDESDKIKIDFLKQEDPGKFNSLEAAITGFTNTATFGQMSKLVGVTESLLGGRPYEDVVMEQAERFRLLEKAFPGSNIAGQAGAFLVPGSPVRSIFMSGAKLGTKASRAIINKIMRDPGFIRKFAGDVAISGTAAGTGSAATGLVSGTLGENLEAWSLDRGGETALAHGIGGGIVGSLIPFGGAAITQTARGGRATSRLLGKGISQLTGVSPQAFRASIRDSKLIQKFSGAQARIGKDLEALLQDQRSKLPEVAAAEELLPQIPDASVAPLIKFLRGFKPTLDESLDSKIKILNGWADRILKTKEVFIGKNGVPKITAKQMREVVDEIQTSVRESGGYGKDSSPFLLENLKTAGGIARESILNSAKASTDASGQLYVGLMEKAAQKRGVLGFIEESLGNKLSKRQANAERLIRTLFGKGKELPRARLQELDEIYGTNFIEQARNAHFAGQLGKGGIPALFPQITTGKSLLGTVVGGAVGSGVGALTGESGGGTKGALIGATISSPKIGKVLLGSSDKITGFLRRMFANPEALARIGKSKTSLYEVRRLAQEIHKTFLNEGPLSSSGVVRIVADSPYFIGLVHAFDIADRQIKGTQSTESQTEIEQRMRGQMIRQHQAQQAQQPQ